MAVKTGTLFIVATPIGNLSDITLRALDTLKSVDLIAAEDTRHSKKLLEHYAIKTPSISLHNYNEAKRINSIIEQLRLGKNIALISDAGTPLISDPGYRLIKAVKLENIKVVPIPGACAAIASLSAAGLTTDKFMFEGFLPAKAKQQLTRLEELKNISATMVFYESPHRILTTIDNMRRVFGEKRPMVIAKELTKMFECIHSGTISEIQTWLVSNAEHQKGEFVILVEGLKTPKDPANHEATRMLELLAKHLPAKLAASITSELTGASKNKLYGHLHKNEPIKYH